MWIKIALFIFQEKAFVDSKKLATNFLTVKSKTQPSNL